MQKDRIEVDVWAWGRGLESWLVDHLVIDGGPESAAAWAALTGLLGTPGRARSGPSLVARLAVDTGYEAPSVYAWARGQGLHRSRRSRASRASTGRARCPPRPMSMRPRAGKRLRRGARLWTVAVSTFKAETYRFLRLGRPTGDEIAGGARMPPGTIHLPDWVDV